MTFAFELAPKFFEVVNLAVVGDPDTAVLVRHWHVAVCRKIENGKPPAPQSKERALWRTMLPYAAIVRAAMHLDGGHPPQRLAISPIGQPANAAHSFDPVRSSH